MVSTTITDTYGNLYRLTRSGYLDGRYFHYTYDEVGNLKTASECLTANTGVCTLPLSVTYTYDAANRLRSTCASALNTVHTYKGLGDRIVQTTKGVTTHYALNRNAGLTQILTERTGNQSIDFAYGPDRLIQQSPSGVQYVLPEPFGSIRSLRMRMGPSRSCNPLNCMAGC